MGVPLVETEYLILSYIRSHSPEECMLDKISLGTGKSRATVLKYLNTLYAQSILDFKIIGRNKLWIIRDTTGAFEQEQPAFLSKKNQDTLSSLVAYASELHDLTVRRMELTQMLDTSDRVILTISLHLTIIAANELFHSQFPDVYSVQDIIPEEKMSLFDHGFRSACNGETVEMDIDFKEKSGLIRMFRLSLVPSKEKKGPGYVVVIGEDISFQRTKNEQESLLYLIRSAAGIDVEKDLFPFMMSGIHDSLLSYRKGFVFVSGHTLAYSSSETPQSILDMIYPHIDRASELCQTQVIRIPGSERIIGMCDGSLSDIMYCIIIPLIEGEQSIGAIVLFIEHNVSRVQVDNVEIIADEIANFLKIQHLEHERSELIHTLEAMNRISEILNSDSDEESLLGRTIDSAMDILGFDVGCVYLMDDSMDLSPVVQRNMPDKLRDLCMSGHFSSLFTKACETNSVLLIRDIDPEFLALGPDINHIGIKTILILPIRVGTTILGLLNMGSREEKIYHKGSLENISSLGMQLGIALERTRFAHAAQSGHQSSDA
nr:GAF domain-containing protein [uncultured Methanospirillum sp.]